MHPIENILGTIQPIMLELITQSKADGIPLEQYTIDHLCYRVSTIELYDSLKETLSQYGENIGEYIINGRPISTILLHTPLSYLGFEIECIELPAPKPGKVYMDGWEHAECAMGMLPEKFMQIYSHINFITDSLHKAINPDIERKYDHFTLKFHEHTLRYVVQILQA